MAAIVSFLFRIIIGGIFLIAGLAKISDPVRFLLTLREFDLFPGGVIRFMAVYIPWLEFILGLFIILGILYRTSSLMLAFLIVIFTVAILSVIIRSMEIDCGCFGLLADSLKIPDSADIRAVIRNTIFIGMCLYISFGKETLFSLEGYVRRRPDIKNPSPQ